MLDETNTASEPIVVFDLGGTHFRSGLYTVESGLEDVRQEPAISFYRRPNLSVDDLKKELMDYVVKTTRVYAKGKTIKRVAISLGAALNGYTGVVYGSAPLWGDGVELFDLPEHLRKKAPEFEWMVLNDLTAGIFHCAKRLDKKNIRKLLLITISTGIACRIIDLRNYSLALDDYGLQGEIGHLPITLNYRDKPLDLVCDCGGHNHIAAFSSGRGLVKLTHLLAQYHSRSWHEPEIYKLQKEGLSYEQALLTALNNKDKFARKLLFLATKPIADFLRHTLSIDPEIDQIVLTGGLVANLESHYKRMLIRHLTNHGLYLSSEFDPALFKRKLKIAQYEEVNNLIGAGLYATQRAKQELFG